MLNKNSIPTGILSSLIFPLIAFAVKYLIKSNMYLLNKPAFPYFAAIAVNLIVIRICFKNDLDKSGRGVMLGSFIVLLAVLIFKL